MDFRPLVDTERRQLLAALRGNAETGAAILTDRLIEWRQRQRRMKY